MILQDWWFSDRAFFLRYLIFSLAAIALAIYGIVITLVPLLK